jgi:hypothetical protein
MASDSLFRQKAPGIMNLLMADFALDVESAAAILGNLGHESGGFQFLQEKKPLISGSAGGWGWAQWTGSRRRAFEAYVERNNLDPAGDTANYKYLFLELKGLEGDEERAIPAVKAAVGLREKVIAFELGFERAHKDHKHYDSRVTWAQRALDAHRDNPNGTIDVKHGGSREITIPDTRGRVDPGQSDGPLAGGFIDFVRAHKDDARRFAMSGVVAFNTVYPDDPIVVQAKAPAPPPPAPSKTDRPSVQLGFAGVIGSLIAMATGHLGTPLGIGVEPTTAGNVAPLVSALIGGVGLLGGGWAGLLGPVLKVVQGGIAAAGKAKP